MAISLRFWWWIVDVWNDTIEGMGIVGRFCWPYFNRAFKGYWAPIVKGVMIAFGILSMVDFMVSANAIGIILMVCITVAFVDLVDELFTKDNHKKEDFY